MKEEPNKDWIDASTGWKYVPALGAIPNEVKL